MRFLFYLQNIHLKPLLILKVRDTRNDSDFTAIGYIHCVINDTRPLPLRPFVGSALTRVCCFMFALTYCFTTRYTENFPELSSERAFVYLSELNCIEDAVQRTDD